MNRWTHAHVMGLRADHLIAINQQHLLQAEVADKFSIMQTNAKTDGIDIQICSSYRTFDKQLSIWNDKWTGKLPLLTLNNQVIDPNTLTEIDKIHAIMLWSALPGASRHHWGSDFDVYDKNQVISRQHKFALVPSEYEGEGPCAELAKWLVKNAHRYEFYLPYAKYVGGVAREPWHLSHKTIAQDIQSSFNFDALYAQIANTDILGKNTLLKHLPNLVERYTFNLGQQTK